MRSGWDRVAHMSFRARLGTLVALAVGAAVALASLASYFTVRHQLYSDVDSALVNSLNSAPLLSGGGGEINVARVSNFVRLSGGFLQIVTSDGSVVSSSLSETNPNQSPMQPSAAEAAMASQNRSYRLDTRYYDGQPYRVITEGGLVAADPLHPSVDGTPVALQIARPLSEITHTLSILRLILWLVTAGGIALAVAIGYSIGRAMLRPVARLTAAAEHVAATQDLGSTIEEDGDDELTRLARSFNAMLTALAESRQQQAQLISDAGHELRTPLTSLRTNIEVLMRRPDLPPGDRSELMADVEAQLQELTTLIGDIVDLARQDEQQTEPIEIRLDPIVERAVERARRRAAGITFDVHLTAGSVRGHPALLERAMLNVLDNAAKWSPPGGTVEVWLQRGACWALDIHDHGPGISPEDLPHVFDRFYRAASARSMPGSGLGLAIVRQVITSHGGTVRASVPPEGGTLVHIELPIVTEMEADSSPGDGGRPDVGHSSPDIGEPGRHDTAWAVSRPSWTE